MSLTSFLRDNLPKILGGNATIARWHNRYTFILAAQNPEKSSQWARLVRSGKLHANDIVWFFRINRTGNRKWIAVAFRRSKKIIVMDRMWFKWFERNLPPKNGWKLEYGKPQVQDAVGPSLV